MSVNETESEDCPSETVIVIDDDESKFYIDGVPYNLPDTESNDAHSGFP